jgi:putative ABC transport system permease protein
MRITLFRRRRDSDLDEELRFHVEKQTEANIAAGMTPEEARRRALAAFGGLEALKEECREARGLPFIEDLLQDARYGLRQLRRNPGFAFVAVLTLALGIGANTAVFSVVNAVLLHPLPYRDPARLVAFGQADEKKHDEFSPVSPPAFLEFRRDNHAFEQLAAYTPESFTYSGTDAAFWAEAASVSSNLFSALGVEPVLGAGFAERDEEPGGEPAAVLSWQFWQQNFGGDRRILGKSIRLSGKPYVVRGVMPRSFRFPYNQPAELWTPLRFTPEERAPAMLGSHYLSGLARLKPGVSIEQAHAGTRLIAQRLKAEAPKNVRMKGDVAIVPLRASMVGDTRALLLLLLGAVGLVLLIATVSVANLMLARATTRGREMAMRAAIGASQARLVRQLLTESLLLAAIAGAFGLLLSAWGTRLLLPLTPSDIPGLQDVGVDVRVLAFAAGCSLVAGVLFGLAPAFALRARDLNQSLKQGGAAGPRAGHRCLRSGLVVAQVAISLVLLAGAGLLLRTFLRLQAVKPGFNPEKVLVAELVLMGDRYRDRLARVQLFDQMLERIERLPGVVSAGASTNLPMSRTNMTTSFSLPDGPPVDPGPRGFGPQTGFRAVSAGYFRTLGIPLLRGRFFDERDQIGAKPAAIINYTLARRYFQGADPVGRHIVSGFRRGDQPLPPEIVGIVGDVKYDGLDRETTPEMFIPYAQMPQGFIRFVVRTAGDPVSLTAAIRDQLRALDKELPLRTVSTMAQFVSDSVAERRFYLATLGAFAALALLLAAAGIYGVVSYAVAQRTHEFGVHMALGAERAALVSMVLGHGLKLVLPGVALGLGGAFASTHLLSKLLFGVTPLDPLTFAGVSLLLAAVALAACYGPARRAARVDPMAALRHE